ncbi:DNA polymerase III subunit delta [Williamsia sp. CHRR-6]|uniref:DNA polymerase III subunit delta n=1 Tax=Williamsia sp. CHRR-6 TaxID=2835871 RepID=UPI002025474C|nr:DNA polymerase III subunit delta [Williamsia sp. CHRR-6]
MAERAIATIGQGLTAAPDAMTGEIPVTHVRAGDVAAPELAELLSPSLFAEDRVVVVESADEAGKEPAALIAEAASHLPEGITLIVAHSGGGRAKSMVPALRAAGAVVHDCATPKWPEDRMRFVKKEFTDLGVKVSAEVVRVVVESVRADLRELAAACSQLVADTGGRVDAAAVTRYYSGRPEIKGYEIAALAVDGKTGPALEALAWARHHGLAQVLIADALGEAVHAIARVRGVAGMDSSTAAAELGMSPKRVAAVKSQAQAWSSAAVVEAVRVVAALNGDVKGQAADADYSVQRAVATIAGLRTSRHD